MPFDPYQPCPCGIDKKVKFCCGSEIVNELNKVEELVSGEQRLAAIDHINRLLAAKPDRACLVLERAIIQMELRELEQAKKSVNELLTLLPSNPSGLGLLATLEALELKAAEAVDTLQQALESAQGRLPQAVYNAIGVVARALSAVGQPLAARGHLLLQVGATGGQEDHAAAALVQLERSGELPLPVLGLDVLAAPESSGRLSAAGIGEVNAALSLAHQGRWLQAAEKLEALAEKEPYDPAVWKNIGILRAWLGNDDKARAALRRYASFASVPRDDAVEAEATAQFLSDPADVDLVPEVTRTFTLSDVSRLSEQLLSNKRFQSVHFDPAPFREANEVPPQAVFLMLSREVPPNSEGLTRETVPVVIGEVLLFGRQTDREARAEFVALRDERFDAAAADLREIIGPLAVGEPQEEVTAHTSRLAAASRINWRLPDQTPPVLRQRLVVEHREHVLLKLVPEIPQGILDGKSLRQAAADPSMQVRALAAILMLDLAEPEERPIYNQLRRSLGLPTVEPLDPQGLRIQSLSPARLVRLDAAKLSDEDLKQVYERALFMAVPRLLRRVAPEIVRRPSLASQVDLAVLYNALAATTANTDEGLEFLHKAQEAATAAGRSPARYLLAEIPLRLARREVEEFRRLFDRLSTRHINEPGIATALQSLLYQLGILRPDGSMAAPREAPPAAAAAPAGGLWTPDQQAPASVPPPASGKSKLIIPGMD
jgi:Flp pilus assembly protein TadD